MDDPSDRLTGVLRDRGVLPAGDALLATWSGRLLSRTGRTDAEGTSAVVLFGVTGRTGHLLSGTGLASFDLADIAGTVSGGPGRLTFTIASDDPPTTVELAVDMAIAIATQLDEMSRATRHRVDRQVTEPVRRPPAKRRTSADAV